MNIDWKMLREQKADLLNVVDLLQSESDEGAKRQTISLDGILSFIEAIDDE